MCSYLLKDRFSSGIRRTPMIISLLQASRFSRRPPSATASHYFHQKLQTLHVTLGLLSRPTPRTTLLAASISRNFAALSSPLSTPVAVIASSSGSREVTALKFPLVPKAHPRA